MIMSFYWMQILPVLEVRSTERVLPVVQAFMETEEYQTYVEDAEVSMRIVPHDVSWVRYMCVDPCLCRECCLLRND